MSGRIVSWPDFRVGRSMMAGTVCRWVLSIVAGTSEYCKPKAPSLVRQARVQMDCFSLPCVAIRCLALPFVALHCRKGGGAGNARQRNPLGAAPDSAHYTGQDSTVDQRGNDRAWLQSR